MKALLLNFLWLRKALVQTQKLLFMSEDTERIQRTHWSQKRNGIQDNITFLRQHASPDFDQKICEPIKWFTDGK